MTRFKKLSKSRGITIPKDMAAELDFDAGTALDLTAEEGKLMLPATSTPAASAAARKM